MTAPARDLAPPGGEGGGTGAEPVQAGRSGLQPLLHDLATAVVAPALVLGAPDGQLDARTRPVSGWYIDDVRLLSRAVLTAQDTHLELIRADLARPDRHEFSYVLRGLGDDTADPTVRLDRTRQLGSGHLTERLLLRSTARDPVQLCLRLEVSSDLGAMPLIKSGHQPAVVPARLAGTARWAAPENGFEVELDPSGAEMAPLPDGIELIWRRRVEPGETVDLTWRATAQGPVRYQHGRVDLDTVTAQAPDRRIPALLRCSLDDVRALALAEGADSFLAAGSPWFLTLFGRDSLWAARLLVPVAPALALSTLRVLAGHQGQRDDAATEEQPGKILHEVRSPGLGHFLPPIYYGTVDATSLFVCLLADAADWGADPDQVRALLPALRRALAWQLAESAETGWLRYVDRTGRGLSNQGWKDSNDSVQYADGRLAQAPIALCEVQAYAYEAAIRGAALLSAHGEPEVPGLLDWAADLRARFDAEFWVDTPAGGHVAIALDGRGEQVDSLTSNLGHLLGTGILDPQRVDRVSAALMGELRSGFGVHTLTPHSPRFSPLSYHGGSVWPHDTAIAVRGLAAEGRLDEAGALAADLLDAAAAFDLRLPELFAGDAAAEVREPAAYPAACRPQAWAAAGAVAALISVTGVQARAGRVLIPERTSTVLGPYRLSGLRAGGAEFAVDVDQSGRVRLLEI